MKKKINNRRAFLGTGLAAAATVAAGNPLALDITRKSIPQKKNNEDPFNPVTYNAMPTRSFGKTGYKVGILSLGGQATIQIKGKEDESENLDTLRAVTDRAGVCL